ncbi:hypothetical protein HDU84_008786 [Entophlyctis sp. JEL0112]|nr:hypothetical protein HDU84_008786 [Entophlyctis sp. JEL0112]
MSQTSWRRNTLPTYTRFRSPLVFKFPSNFSESPVTIIEEEESTGDPVVDSDETSSLTALVFQRLDTVNCVWDAATALCGLLVTSSDSLLDRCMKRWKPKSVQDFSTNVFTVVEIGSGCGLVGVLAKRCLDIAAKKLRPSPEIRVILTDMAEEVPILQKTVAVNFGGDEIFVSLSKLLAVQKVSTMAMFAEPLFWGKSDDFENLKRKFDTKNSRDWVNLILATDIVYEIQHFKDLVASLNDLCPRFSKTLMLMAMEHRWSDVTGFWWDECKKSGWKWEVVSKDDCKQFWWGQTQQIQIGSHESPDNSEGDDFDASLQNTCSDWPVLDSLYEYRFFISYRVDANAQFALELYLRLKDALLEEILNRRSLGEHAQITNEKVFLDRECLVDGEDWRNGFVNGLKRSTSIILVISEKAISRMMSSAKYQDNVLLEWETAFMAFKQAKCQIIPNYVEYTDTESMESVVHYCLMRMQNFNSELMGSIRKKQICTDQFAAGLWAYENFTLNRDLTLQDMKLIPEMVQFNTCWASMKLDQQLGNVLAEFVCKLPESNCIEFLNLSGNLLGIEGVVRILKAASSFNALQGLNLSDNHCGGKFVEAALTNFLSKSQLLTLDISKNSDIFVDPTAIGLSNLKELHVGYSDCLLGDQYMCVLDSHQNSKIKVLAVEDCNISEQGLRFLLDNNTVEELNLAQNSLLHSSAAALALKNSLCFGAKALTVLVLNGITLATDYVVTLLADGILGSSCLEQLHVQECRLDAANFGQISKAICAKESVKILNASRNPLGLEGIKKLHLDLKQHSNKFLEICLYDCGVPNDQIFQIFSKIMTRVDFWGMDGV